ncbi:MAG: hypothetical protein ACREM6_01685 [Vulcanimicrobiaceae bacterium]
MAIHRRALEHYIATDQELAFAVYRRSLLDSFGPQYVAHLERWLEADGIGARDKVV